MNHLVMSHLSGLIPRFRGWGGGSSSEHVLDEIVHLVEHHEVNGQTRASVLGGGVACQPGEGVVLLENKSAEGGRCR